MKFGRMGQWSSWTLGLALVFGGLLGAGQARAQVAKVAGSLPEGEAAPEEGVLLQPTHKEKYVLMPRVGYMYAFKAWGPNPGQLGEAADTDDLGRNNATSMGDGRWDTVSHWTAGLEFRKDIKKKFFMSLEGHGVLIGDAGYGLRTLPPFPEPRALGAGTMTGLLAAGMGTYIPLGESRLAWMRLGLRGGYMYGVAAPGWLNLEYQQHIMLHDASYLSVSLQGQAGFMVPPAMPDFQEQFTRRLWVDQVRGFVGLQLGMARVFPDRASRFTSPADKMKDSLPLP